MLYVMQALIVVAIKMESRAAYSNNSAIENFREYLRIKTVQPKPDYGNICRMLLFFLFYFFNVLFTFSASSLLFGDRKHT